MSKTVMLNTRCSLTCQSNRTWICLQTNMATSGRKQKLFCLMSMFSEETENDESSNQNDDDEELVLFAIVEQFVSTERVAGVRIPNYFEEVIPRYPDNIFKSHFRLRKSSVEKLCEQISTHFMPKQNAGGREPTPIAKQVLMFLWYLATKETIREISDRFDNTFSLVFKAIRRVANAISEILAKQIIVWPHGDECEKVTEGFYKMKKMDNVIGAIDGTHIPISGQNEHNENYINRKGFSSIILQAVCNHKMKFTDVYVGWPGSVHDARVFANSDLLSRIEQNPFHLIPNGCFMVGDAAYPLSSFMMTPYRGIAGMNQLKHRYNYVQSATRIVIERAFGVLKGRFPRLKLIDMKNVDDICLFVLVACVMHNFCIDENEDLGDEANDFVDADEEQINNFITFGSSSKDAERKRDAVAKNLFDDFEMSNI